MPQFVANGFSVNDGSTTPVAVTYAPELLSSARTVLVDRRLMTREQQPSIVYTFDPSKPTRKTYKVLASVAIPIVQVINSVETVTGTLRANAEFIIPENASGQMRKHLRAAMANALDHAYIRAGVEDLDPLY
jgi:hypothetical protein